MRFVWICVAFVIPQLLYLIYHFRHHSIQRRRYIDEHGCKTTGPSYPHIPFLLGLDFLYENAVNILHRKFALGVRQRFELYGTTHTARLLHRRMVNTIDPENLQAVMKTNFDDYTIIPGREKLMRVLFGVGIFGTEGDDWKHSRQLVRNSMWSLHLDCHVFEAHFKQLLDRLQTCGGQGKTVDFGQLAFGYTLGVATDIIIGRTMSGTDEEDLKNTTSHQTNRDQFGRDFGQLGKMARVLTIMISQIPYLTNIVYWRSYNPTQKRIFDHVDDHIRRAQKQYPTQQLSHQEIKDLIRDPNHPAKNLTLLEGLASQSQDITRIRSEALHLLLASHDTVGIALSELFWCLARSPNTWTKLRAEVHAAYPPNLNLNDPSPPPLPTIASLKKLPYLTHVINEAIRIRPTLSVHGRRAIKDTTIPRGGGSSGLDPLFVPKGTYIVYSNYALYRNSAVFGADVDEFRPERWEEGVKPERYEYLNFGAGPRACPGRELGWAMLAYVTVRLAQSVERLGVKDWRPWEENRGFSFLNCHGVLIEMVLDKGR